MPDQPATPGDLARAADPFLTARLRVTRSGDRIEGSLTPDHGDVEIGFTGTLELLRVLEDLVPRALTQPVP